MVAEIIEGAVGRLGAAGMERELAVEALVRLLVLADVELDELDVWLRAPLHDLAAGRRVRPDHRMQLLAAHGFVCATGEGFELTAKGAAELGEARAA